MTTPIKIQERLVTSEIRYRRLFETARDGILILDAESLLITDVNPFLMELLGYDRSGFIGKELWEIGLFQDKDASQAAFLDLREKGYLRYEDLPLETKTGVIREVEFISNVYEEEDGRHVIQCDIRDITERKMAQDEVKRLNSELERRVVVRTSELETANEELEAFTRTMSQDLRVAEAADRIKSAFLATMSHELRTPLNSILGFTGILLQGLAGPLNAEQNKQLGMVRTSARHLLELIHDVLDLSKIEAGQLEVHAEPFDLRASIESVTASIQPMADKKGLVLTADIAPYIEGMVSDRRRVEQILINILSNAVKFTESGTVTLTVKIDRDHKSAAGGEARPVVVLQVSDTGIGIKPRDLATLFQPFRQIESRLARQNEGTGLGLAISRRLSEVLHGEISASSEWSKGSVFTVILPIEKIV